ncbi:MULTISPECIES: alpha/beta-type small acid-soluble spore protein [Paenibacillus]|uniref:alpha/beta-type small acid-soluble spore protein n=1 Tax=Paenibacillus TaxID=44249 RepID=UPI002041108A|nr:alpha/beta-type small acid-soluble spore protein [Paenibacillus camelliae]MCM3635232.1 alpha/beta-type small acid-soluble spore protein [Paenibacillus camelliae]
MSRRNQVVVPEAKAALEAMKYELAAELGLYAAPAQDLNSEFADELGAAATPVKGSIDWATVSTRNVGYIGGSITKRLIQQAEQVLGRI